MSDRPVNLASPEALYVYLEQLNTAGNFVNGAPSTLLTVVEISRNPPSVPQVQYALKLLN